MGKLDLLSATAVIWVGTLGVFLLPGRWLGSWIAKTSPNTFFGVLFCIALSVFLIVFMATAVVFAGLPSLYHLNTRFSFVLVSMAALFFVPALAAQLIGFRRAKAPRKPDVPRMEYTVRSAPKVYRAATPQEALTVAEQMASEGMEDIWIISRGVHSSLETFRCYLKTSGSQANHGGKNASSRHD